MSYPEQTPGSYGSNGPDQGINLLDQLLEEHREKDVIDFLLLEGNIEHLVTLGRIPIMRPGQIKEDSKVFMYIPPNGTKATDEPRWISPGVLEYFDTTGNSIGYASVICITEAQSVVLGTRIKKVQEQNQSQ